MMPVDAARWPYPRWIAHRGAGKLAPENTLAAFRHGAALGYRMYECDVKLSADGVAFLLHDATLERTCGTSSTGSRVAGHCDWAELSRLDAGRWHSRQFAGEPIPSLDAVARHCLANGHLLNIEIKPTPGEEARTGQVVADTAATLWQDAEVPPLLTSFRPESLLAAASAQPALPRGLLLDSLWDGWFETARSLGCVAIVCNYGLWTGDLVAQVRAAGWRMLSYTVNDSWVADHLLRLGTDGIITDRLDLFAPAA